jgi:hypothetical protein
MTQNIAVAVIHGVGRQGSDFAEGIIGKVKDRFGELISGSGQNPDEVLVMEPALWAPVLENEENELWRRLKRGGDLDFVGLRQFMVSFAADAIAYQPVPKERAVYDAIHAKVAESLKRLAEKAGPKAPLCIVAHSLGTVIASNYFYDLQNDANRDLIAPAVRALTGDTPLERGETFASFYTFGSPIALWSLRYTNFGKPIAVPSPKLAMHQPSLPKKCEWINFYDRDDILAYPLRKLNQAYRDVVTEDRAVNVGGWLTSWNPLSHTAYWTDRDVTTPIAEGLAGLWKAVNA